VLQCNFSLIDRLILESTTLTRDGEVVVHQGVRITWYFRLWTSFTLTAIRMDLLQTNSGKTVLVFYFVVIRIYDGLRFRCLHLSVFLAGSINK